MSERESHLPMSYEELSIAVLNSINDFKREYRENQNEIKEETNGKFKAIIDGQSKYEEKMDNKFKESNDYIHSIAIEVAKLQVKSSVWGFLAGAVPTGAALLWFILTKQHV